MNHGYLWSKVVFIELVAGVMICGAVMNLSAEDVDVPAAPPEPAARVLKTQMEVNMW